MQKDECQPNTTMKLGSIGAYALRGALAKYVTDRPDAKTEYGHMDRVVAATALSDASGHTVDDSMLIVAALENSGFMIVKEVTDAC